jgi:hypothetical protein
MRIRRFKWIDFLLIVLTAVGALKSCESSRTLATLQRRYSRTVELIGELPISDTSKVHILALPQDNPLHFAWRIYVPENRQCNVQTTHHSGGSSGSMGSSSKGTREFLFQASIHGLDEGRISFFKKYDAGSSQSGLGNPTAAKFLLENFSQFTVEQGGAKEIAMLARGEKLTLLQIRIPPALAKEFQQTLGYANGIPPTELWTIVLEMP